MIELKTLDSKRLIPIEHLLICKEDNLSLEEICKLYTYPQVGKKCGAYKLDKFIFHIKTRFNLTIREYLMKYFNFDWPLCPTKQTQVGFKTRKEGILLSDFAIGGMNRENCPAFAKFCERESIERRGEGNPMFGKQPWNEGLTKDTDERLKKLSEQRMGFEISEESKVKMRQRRKESPIKARHTTKHTPETIEKLKLHTAKLWAEGRFNRTTSIHIKMREFLATLDLKEQVTEEFQVKYFSMDFAFPSVKIAIECQGQYFHVDPRVYPNGPIDKIQRRNFGRDKAKRKICCDQEGWIILEAWEAEINDGTFKEQIKCKLKELNLLN